MLGSSGWKPRTIILDSPEPHLTLTLNFQSSKSRRIIAHLAGSEVYLPLPLELDFLRLNILPSQERGIPRSIGLQAVSIDGSPTTRAGVFGCSTYLGTIRSSEMVMPKETGHNSGRVTGSADGNHVDTDMQEQGLPSQVDRG